MGASSDRSFTITNTGAQPLTGTVAESCDHCSIVSGGGSYSLTGGESRTVTVRYAPAAAGSHSCSIDTGASGCADVSCTGTATIGPPPDMVLVPAGAFTMGSDHEQGAPDERPEHQPYISAFYIDKYEVSSAHYAQALNWARGQGLVQVDAPGPNGIVYGTTGNREPYLFMDQGSDEANQCRITWDGASFGVEAGSENRPVVYVTWWGAATYCNGRSGMAGRTPCYNTSDWDCNFAANGYRLPTEAEWEKAARGGADERTYPWGDGAISCNLANYFPDPTPCVGRPETVDDARYAAGASPYGVWQIAGNEWEWRNDWFEAGCYANSPSIDPRGPANTGYRVTRGGSWWDGKYWQRCAVREGHFELDTFDRLGLRAVLSTGEVSGCQVHSSAIVCPETAVGSAVDRTFTVTNPGSGTLMGEISEGCQHFELTSGGGSYSLGAGQSRTVTVRYALTAPGAHACTIETGASACADVSCTGTATGAGGAGCSVVPASITFAATAVGDHKDASFVITNNGTTTLSGTVSETCPHFDLQIGGGAYRLSPGQQHSVVARTRRRPPAPTPARSRRETPPAAMLSAPASPPMVEARRSVRSNRRRWPFRRRPSVRPRT